METYSAIVRFFQDGGWIMYPIVLVLAIGISIAVERWIYLTRTSASNQRVWNSIVPLLKSGNFAQVAAITRESGTAIGTILTYGLDRVRSARRREDIEQAMEESLMEVVPRLERRTHYLATFANIATLMGLLGTVMGLIEAFTAVANVNPSEKASMLSSSISVAMNATAFGLVVAIPLLLIHSVLTSKTTRIVDSLEMAAVKFLNSLSDRAPAPSAPAGTSAK
jgi:biopolymer transport protein ExbB/TolQ